ncbi:VCBS repeat-containing protein [Streptomyces sp. TRM76323]|uniref:VCBS repeat-containing protein n=1 Tax=Streptomyces tamarix TaxID=3078565 RepID=A0ABU3QHC2_9ACTN|nr:VCBS repeat-containing protein [Streptomyces tamarix]MDT9682160.1 VCBS repeat-containing protein [Streptomyces tamarix]
MRGQGRTGSARMRSAAVAATAAALLAAGTGGVAGAAPNGATAATFTLGMPDAPAGGGVTHTVKVNASANGRFELTMEPAEGFRWWNLDTEASALNRGRLTGGPGVTCWEEPFDNGEQRALCDVPAGTSTLTYSVRPAAGMEAWGIEANVSFRPEGSTATSTGQAVFHVLSDDRVEMSYRVFGRDSAGRLYSHETLPQEWEPLAPGMRWDHGSGWGAFDAVTKLSPIGVDNRGGGVVAREPSGTLWYYPASGVKGMRNVFKPRVRVGTGWSAHTSVRGTGDVTGDGHADLVARDKAGVLWLYRGTGVEEAPFAARTRVGSGWQVYNALTGGVDSTGDGIADLFARDTAGALWLYRGTGNAARPYAPRIKVGRSGWNAYTAIIAPGDGSPAGRGALLVRDKAGTLYWYDGTGVATAPLKARRPAGQGSQPYNAWM